MGAERIERRHRNAARLAMIALFLGGLQQAALVRADEPTIGIIDLYGLSKVSREAVQQAAALNVGEGLPKDKREIVKRLEAIPGIKRAAVAVVTAHNPPPATGLVGIIYIGIDEGDRPQLVFRPAGTSQLSLPDEVVRTHEEFESAFREMIRGGDLSENFSQGHSLFGNSQARAVQEQFIPQADQHFDRLAEVLREAKSSRQRQIAAWVIGYATDKPRAAKELVAAVRDADSHVRNDALRALTAILYYASDHPELAIETPVDLIIEMLNSVDWTDRNKAMAVLQQLSKKPEVLAKLRERSLPTLVEMSRWHYEGHAMQAYILLARLAGVTDEEATAAWQAQRREEVIAKALATAAAPQKPAAETSGIGVALKTDEGRLIVGHVLPDSPAAASKSIGPGDRILDVANGNDAAVDVTGMKLESVTQLIRGPKGSTIRLTIIPAGKELADARAISLVRGGLKELERWGDGVELVDATPAPNIKLIRLDSMAEEKLADYSGKIVVLEFWAIWCKPCQQLLAELQAHAAQNAAWKDQVVVIAASVDEDPAAAAEHLKTKGWSELRGFSVNDDALKAFHVNSLPTTYVIDPQGRVVGPRAGETIEKTIERLLKK